MVRGWLLAMLMVLGLAGPVAAETAEMAVIVEPAQVVVGQEVAVRITAPVWTPVYLDVTVGGVTQNLASFSTDSTGVVATTWRPVEAGTAVLTARAGEVSAATSLTIAQADAQLGIAAGDGQVRSETPVSVSAHLLLSTGVPWASSVAFEYKPWKGPWRDLRSAATAADGRTSALDRPWKTTQYRVRFPGDEHARGGVSQVATVTTSPARRPVRRPKHFPEPRAKHRKPDRPAPVGKGPNAHVRRIDDRTFRTMRGLSWQRGCLPRSSLRLVGVNYWGFDGYRYRGQLVVHASIAGRMARAFSSFHRIRYPIRQMRLVDDFGRSRWKGANDYRSMAADNTSAFNCRYVVGREPHVLSPHASGRSIDINPWENPYRSPRGTYPNSAYLNRSVRHPAVINANSRVRRIMGRAGCSWLGYSDSQHFDCWGSARRAAAAMAGKYPRINPGGKYGWGME